MVPLDDPAYVYLDRLEELGLVRSAIMGQRPYSYREMGRLAREGYATAATARAADPGERMLIDALLARLDARIPDVSVRSALLDDALLGMNRTDAVRRAPPPAGSGAAPHATIDPLAVRRLGDPFPAGRSLALEAIQRAEPLGWLAFQARERVTLREPADNAIVSQQAAVLGLAARARWGNVAVTVGRAQLGWGSGGRGGLFLAADAPALDQLSLAPDRPFVLPWLLRRLGPVSGTITLAEMGPSAVRSRSKMLAYKVSARPTAAFEVGGTFQNHFGGEGGRRSSFLYRVIDFLPMIDIFRRHNYVDTTVVFDVDSDKMIGLDARWRIDRLGGVIVEGEWLMDDFDVQRLGSMLNYAASHALSVTVPRLGSPAWSLWVGATHMGPLTYTHSTLVQGMTTRGRLLGNELGPDTKAFSAELRWMPSASASFSVEARSAVYSNATYAAGYDINGRWIVEKRFSAPDELREQAVGTVTVSTTPSTSLGLRGGVERTRNVMFTGGRRFSYVLDAGVRWRP